MPVYLVRHASAGARDVSNPYDHERPLDAYGRQQAENLAELLAAEPIERVLSSPAPRCFQTVEPLAARHGLTVEIEQHLDEGASIEAAHELLESCAGSDVVLCSHGDVIPELINRLARRGMVITSKKRGGAKGSVWTIEWDGDHFAAAAYSQTSG